MLLQKQTAFTGTWQVTLDYPALRTSTRPGQRSGGASTPMLQSGSGGEQVDQSGKLFSGHRIRTPNEGNRTSSWYVASSRFNTYRANLLADDYRYQEKTVPVNGPGGYTFRIEAEPLRYRFYLRSEVEAETDTNEGFTLVVELASSLLVRTRAFDSIFTGTHLAIYAVGAHQESSLQPAYFSDPSWRGIREGGD